MPVLRVALDLPLYRLFDYGANSASTADIGFRVRVPFGRSEKIGVIIDVVVESDWPKDQIKMAGEILRDLPPLPADFFKLCEFASTYYQAAFGEVVLQALPVGLKRLDPPIRRNARVKTKQVAIPPPPLTEEQRAALAVNRELVLLYWQIGRDILARQAQQGWGAKVIERLAHDLRAAFPEMKGFSRANLMYMRAFAEAWPDAQIVQQAVGQLPWGHNLVLLTQLKNRKQRLAYAQSAIQHGWSRNMLNIHIETRLLERSGTAVTKSPKECTTLIEPGGEVLKTIRYTRPSSTSQTPYTITVPGIADQAITVLVP